MDTKLTLSIDEDIIRKAKHYARIKGQSLSDIIENYLKIITDKEPDSDKGFSPLVKSLKGSFTAPADFNYKKELKKSLSKRYFQNG